MPVEFTRNDACIDIHEQIVCGSMKLVMAYDGSGRRMSKTQLHTSGNGVWDTVLVTHYTGMGTENFTGKERDDETQLDYFGARYLDPMLGMWTSVDLARQFASDYALRLYCGPKSIEKTKRPKATSPTR